MLHTDFFFMKHDASAGENKSGLKSKKCRFFELGFWKKGKSEGAATASLRIALASRNKDQWVGIQGPMVNQT